MKLQLETQEWQLLGQIAIEISEGMFPKGMLVQSMLIWEFYLENLQAFSQPQVRKRKIRNSTAIAIYQYLKTEQSRYDILWDITILTLTDKIYQKIQSLNTFEIITFQTPISAN